MYSDPNYPHQQMPSIPEEQIGGVAPRGLQRMRVADSENISEFNIQQSIDPSYEFSEGGGKPFIKRDIGWGEALYDYQSLFEKMDIFPGTWEDKPGSKLPKSYDEESERLQPYMENPVRNAWDSQIENNKNRNPYNLNPPEIY